MKNEILILTLIASLGLGITSIEHGNSKASKNETDSSFEILDYNSTGGIEHNSAVSNFQYVNMIIIVDVLQNYSAERMEKAIEMTFDENVISYKKTFGIMNEMSELITALKGAESTEIIYENSDIISLKFTKGENLFQLDIHFKEYSEKIEKMQYYEMN